MTRIEVITEIPPLAWTENSTREYNIINPDELIVASSSAFQISYKNNIYAVLGFIYPNLCSPPFMWLFLTEDCEKYMLQGIKTLKQAIVYLPPGTVTAVARGFDRGKRFAEFFGFKNIGVGPTIEGRVYDVYRRN